MLANEQVNWIKRFYRAKQKQWFGEVQDCKDRTGLMFSKFHFVTGQSTDYRLTILGTIQEAIEQSIPLVLNVLQHWESCESKL